ncbi:hypothetical protein KC19_11G040100 [Ceratodon purpureus]|uniref:Protein kinase domain-containing protein n=1 Tax=Ceratodon purpureus TaxID=3225 RepID=A0A8T0GAU0_CERPU|nr:hypothetical protein KC19_11G040100 [Ceratodon purpureus]
MAQPEFMTQAEGDFASTSAGTRPVMEESTATMERSTLSSAKEESSCSGAGASAGRASFIRVLLRRVFPCLRDSTHSSSEYLSTRNQSIVEYLSTRNQSIVESKFETEIEASKVHWSELPPGSGAQGCAEADMELFRRLQQQYASPDGRRSFFQDWREDWWEVGEKIAEGAQGAIHHLRWLLPEDADMNGKWVVKVFKLEGWSLEALHQQWPPAMLDKIRTAGFYRNKGISGIGSGWMLKDGRFAFSMPRYWGDLRKMIDLRLVRNRLRPPPFSNEITVRIMYYIAKGMLQLHRAGILHRDLKASNVLIKPRMWKLKDAYGKYDPIDDDEFDVHIADYECSVAVWGTRFWRAPEILLGLKKRRAQPSLSIDELFTEKSDVYSYAMTCYEVLTGKIPLNDLPPSKDDEVIQHNRRPVLPLERDSWIQSMLRRCWHQDPSRRPSFEQIVEDFESPV